MHSISSNDVRRDVQVFHVLSRLLALKFGGQQLLGSAWGRWHRCIRDIRIYELEYKLEEKSLQTNETKKQLVSAVHSSVQSVNQLSEALVIRDEEIRRLEKELESRNSIDSQEATQHNRIQVAQRIAHRMIAMLRNKSMVSVWSALVLHVKGAQDRKRE